MLGLDPGIHFAGIERLVFSLVLVHETLVMCGTQNCHFLCNGSAIVLYVNLCTGVLEYPGYLECSMGGREVEFGINGVQHENVEIGRNWVNVTLDSVSNTSITVNSLRYTETDNSDPPLYYRVVVVNGSVGMSV